MNTLPDTGFFTTLLPYIIQVDVEEARACGGYPPIMLPEPIVVITLILPNRLRLNLWNTTYATVTEITQRSDGRRQVKAAVKHATLQKIILDYAASSLI